MGDGVLTSGKFLVASAQCKKRVCNYPFERTDSMSDQQTSVTTEKTCPRCAAVFECLSGGCWCNDVRLSAAKLESLQRKYDDCLCPTCLASIESRCESLECSIII